MPLNDDLDALTQTFRADQGQFDVGPVVRCIWDLYTAFIARGAEPPIAAGLAVQTWGVMLGNVMRAQQSESGQT